MVFLYVALAVDFSSANFTNKETYLSFFSFLLVVIFIALNSVCSRSKHRNPI